MTPVSITATVTPLPVEYCHALLTLSIVKPGAGNATFLVRRASTPTTPTRATANTASATAATGFVIRLKVLISGLPRLGSQ